MSSVPVVDPGEGPTLPPLFLDQTKAQKAEKIFSDTDPPYLRVSMTAPAPIIERSESATECPTKPLAGARICSR